jgi:hypothetical protein
MPLVARGGSRWTAAEDSHLKSCAECAAEWGVVRGVAALGSDLHRSIDTARIAEGVLVSLRSPAPRPGWSRHARWAVPVAMAAGLLLMLVRPRDAEVVNEVEAVTLTLLPEAESLSDTDLESVIRLIPIADPADVGVEALTDEELTVMLQDLEG